MVICKKEYSLYYADDAIFITKLPLLFFARYHAKVDQLRTKYKTRKLDAYQASRAFFLYLNTHRINKKLTGTATMSTRIGDTTRETPKLKRVLNRSM